MQAILEQRNTATEPTQNLPKPTLPFLLHSEPTVPSWEKIEHGLELGRFFAGTSATKPTIEIVILRFDPNFFSFSIHAGSNPAALPVEKGTGDKRSLKEWARQYDLVAATNAGMYLEDGKTNTGYLQTGDHLNNPRVVRLFGAFFMAEPKDNAKTPEAPLPQVSLLDRTTDPWEALLPQYSMVVQNYRLISSARKNLWQPTGPTHSIAAVGVDGQGHILFIHCHEPLTVHAFGNLLLDIPIDIRTVMYVEGGSPATLFLNTKSLQHTWTGYHPADFFSRGNPELPLPNVIGVRRKTSTQHKE